VKIHYMPPPRRVAWCGRSPDAEHAADNPRAVTCLSCQVNQNPSPRWIMDPARRVRRTGR